MKDLIEVYKFLTWPMKPDDPRALERVENIVKFMREKWLSHPSFKPLHGNDKIRLLELGCGTGVAGAAISKVLEEMEVDVEATFTDIRPDDLKYVDKWIEILQLGRIRYETKVVDARELRRYVDNTYDLIVYWGSSMPHFNTFEYISMISNIYQSSRKNSVVMIQQANLGWDLLIGRSFSTLVREGEINEKGEGLISIYNGYNPITGTQKRAYYTIPGYKYIGTLHSRLWDISSLLGILWIYYTSVDAIPYTEFRSTYVLLAWERRESPGKNLDFSKFIEG